MTNRKRYSIILSFLAGVAAFTWVTSNAVVARQMRLVEYVEIGDLEAVKYILRWDQKQVNQTQELPGVTAAGGMSRWLRPKWRLIAATQRWQPDVGVVPPELSAKPLKLSGYYSSRNRSQFRVMSLCRPLADTPLGLAARRGQSAILAVLLQSGANVDVPGSQGRTALHWTASGGRTEAARLLLAAGAGVNAKDANGRSPLDLSSNAGELQKLLRAHGAKTGDELRAEAKK